MRLSTILRPPNFSPLIGLVLLSLTLQSQCFPGSIVNSSHNDSSYNRNVPSPLKYLDRSIRSTSNETNSQERLPISFGLLVATGRYNGSAISYCVAHYNYDTISHEETHFYNLIKVDGSNFCSPPATRSQNNQAESGSYILINFNTKCPLAEQAFYVQQYYSDSKGLIISLPNDVNVYNLSVQKNVTDPNFIIALIGEDSTSEILIKYGDQVKAMIYSPRDDDEEAGIFESSLLGIWFVAVLTVTIGGYSSGILRYELFLTRQLHEAEDAYTAAQSSEEQENDQAKKKQNKNKLDDASLDVTPTTVIFFVIYMCVVLLILYFFYSYLVFMMIIFFVVFCTISIYSLIMGLTVNYVAPRLIGKWAQYGWRFGVTLISLIAPVTWFFIRKSSQAWSLQNSLAMIFCIHVLQMLRFPNYRITSLLLSLLFIYDIFFVFLTPYLTSDGESIMVKVATGGSSSEISYSFGAKTIGESLPVVFQWPRALFSNLLTDKCYQGRVFSTSKLGFGDVLVPGFLISYCHALDLFQKTPYRLYFTVECIFYGIGLIITFIALNLMKQAQPALLYLVPATLIPPLVIAWYRNEINILWYGPEPAAIEARLKEKAAQALDNVNSDHDETVASNNPKESLVNNQSSAIENSLEPKAS